MWCLINTYKELVPWEFRQPITNKMFRIIYQIFERFQVKLRTHLIVCLHFIICILIKTKQYCPHVIKTIEFQRNH